MRRGRSPPGKTLEAFDWGFQPKADRRQIDALATCRYLRDKTNVLFLGPSGVGTSHRSIALGVQTIKNGFSVAPFVPQDAALLTSLTPSSARRP